MSRLNTLLNKKKSFKHGMISKNNLIKKTKILKKKKYFILEYESLFPIFIDFIKLLNYMILDLLGFFLKLLFYIFSGVVNSIQ